MAYRARFAAFFGPRVGHAAGQYGAPTKLRVQSAGLLAEVLAPPSHIPL
jgi:hypothetical protein